MDSFRKHLQYAEKMDYQAWYVVGIIAEACRVAGLVFQPPTWSEHENEWWADCHQNGGWSTSPAEAALLAVAAYLSANPVTPERKD